MRRPTPSRKGDFLASAKALRVAMTEHDETASSLARCFGCTAETIRRVLRNPLQSPLVAIYLALTLGVPIDAIFTYCPQSETEETSTTTDRRPS